MKPKVIKNVQIHPSFLKDDCEYLDYYTEDEYLESSPGYKAKYVTVKVFEEGRIKIKKVPNLDINKVNSQSIFSVACDSYKSKLSKDLNTIPFIVINQRSDIIRKSESNDEL